MKKKIVFWCPFFGKVGTANAVIESVKALNESKKFHCKVMNVFGEFDEYSDFFSKNNIEEIKLTNCKFVNYTPKKGFFWSRLNYLFIVLISFIPLICYLKKNPKDIFFTYLLNSLPFFVIKFFNFKNKIVFRISGKINYTFLRKIIFKYARKKIFKVFIQTKFAKKNLIKQEIFDKKRISFLGDPIIDIKKINKLKRNKIENKFAKKPFYIAIGRLTRQKNFSFLIESISEIMKSKKFNLLILGDGEQKKFLNQIVRKKKLQKRIFLLGYKKNIYGYLNKSKGLICTSLWEEPGFIIQEAAACKKIILTSNCESGPSEFLNNGRDGYIFLSNNKESFIKNFYRMIDNSKMHKIMIRKNHNKIQRYSREYFKNRIIKELLSN